MAARQELGNETVFLGAERGRVSAGVQEGGEIDVGERLSVGIRAHIGEFERARALEGAVQFAPKIVARGGGNLSAELKMAAEAAQGAPKQEFRRVTESAHEVGVDAVEAAEQGAGKIEQAVLRGAQRQFLFAGKRERCRGESSGGAIEHRVEAAVERIEYRQALP